LPVEKVRKPQNLPQTGENPLEKTVATKSFVAVEKAVALEKVVIPVEKAGKPQNLPQTGENVEKTVVAKCSVAVEKCTLQMCRFSEHMPLKFKDIELVRIPYMFDASELQHVKISFFCGISVESVSVEKKI
jgi:hypothetical protein